MAHVPLSATCSWSATTHEADGMAKLYEVMQTMKSSIPVPATLKADR